MRESKGFEIRRRAARCVCFGALAAVLFLACGCGEQLTRMEENQIRLQAMVAANARELATLSSQIHTGQAKLGDGIQNLDAQAQGISAGVQTVQGNQQRLHETVVAGHQGLDARATALQEGQQSLQARVTGVQDTADRTASDLTALAQRHAGLHETVQANQRELNNHMGAVAANQQGIQAGITRLQEADAGLARDIASVAGKHDALSTAMQDNDRQVAERLTTLAAGHDKLSADAAGIADRQTALHAAVRAGTQTLSETLVILERNQQNHQTGIDRVFATASQTAATIAAMAAAQTAMQESLDASHETLTVQVAASRQSLQTAIDTLNGKADKAALDSATVAASLQDSLRISRDVVTGQMAASLQNQQAIQTAVQEVGRKADNLATNLAAISADQTTARETSRTNHDAIITAMASLSEGHETLHTGVDRINSELTSVTAEQKGQRETTRVNHDAIAAQIGSLSRSQADLHAGLGTLNDKADAASAELSAAAQRQNAMQQALAAQATVAAENQQNLKAGIADLSDSTRRMAAAQDSFRQMQQSHNDAITARAAGLADGQQGLRNQVDTLTATTNQTALSMLTLNNGQATFQQAMQTGMSGLHERANQTTADVRGMAERQTAFQESIRTSNKSLMAQTSALAEGQQALKADLGKAANVIDRAYADLTTVAIAQETLQSTLASRSDEIGSRVARIESNQKGLADNLDVLTATTGQTAVDVLGLADGHADLQRSILTGNDTVIARTTTLAENQEMMGNHLDVLTATTGQTAIDVLALANDQSKLTRTVHNGLAGITERTDRIAASQGKAQGSLDVLTATAGQTALDLIDVAGRQDSLHASIQNYAETTGGQIARLAGDQQKMQAGVDTLTATTAQTALDVTGVASRQETLQRAVRNHSDSTTGQMTKLAQNQQQVQSGMGVLTATAGQTAQDVIEVATRQDALRKAIQSHDESISGRMVKLNEDQQKMQTGLDAVTAATGQTTRDVAALNETQARSEQAAQAGRLEVAATLAEMAQTQQDWLRRLDTAQARIQAMADGVATLDQQLAQLQGALQAGVQNTTTLLDANGQQRQRFEATIVQDVQAMINAIAQLRQAQAQLQEQMSQVQKSTQSQAETLKATIDQIKQPPAEVKVSDAAKPAEPAIAQTGE